MTQAAPPEPAAGSRLGVGKVEPSADAAALGIVASGSGSGAVPARAGDGGGGSSGAAAASCAGVGAATAGGTVMADAAPDAPAAPVMIEESWVQCDKCSKWRLLPPGSTMPPDNVPWYAYKLAHAHEPAVAAESTGTCACIDSA
eukprot:364858-Chlamydomonas_euryale.AAC.10